MILLIQGGLNRKKQKTVSLPDNLSTYLKSGVILEEHRILYFSSSVEIDKCELCFPVISFCEGK